MVFPFIAVTLDTDIVILGVQSLSIARPGASFDYLGDHFVSLGTPERTMEGHMGAQDQMTESTPRVIGVAVGKR